MKKLLAGAVASAVVLLGAAACQQDDNPGESTGGDDGALQISMIGKLTDDHFTLVRAGAMAAGEDLGVTVNYNAPDTANEADRQLNMLQSAITSQPDAIGLAPQDGIQDSAPTQMEQAGDVPFVIFDTPLPGSDLPVVTITSHNTGVGSHLAEQTAEAINGQGKVAVVTNGVLGTAAERRDGFLDWIEENAPDIEVVTVQNGEDDAARSRDIAQAILQGNPDLDALVGTSIHATIAIADEVAARGADTLVFGVDSGPDVLTQLEAGMINGFVAQNPYAIGYQTVEALVAAANGEEPEESLVYTDSAWITQDNLDDPYIRTILGLDD